VKGEDKGDLTMWNSALHSPASFWLRVFYNSKVNGAPYAGDKLPANNWSWPTDTYLQRRLRQVRSEVAHSLQASELRQQKTAGLQKALAPNRRRAVKRRRTVH
jgi:hypothetical protein